MLPAINFCHKGLQLRFCGSPRYASAFFSLITINSQNTINNHHNCRTDSDKDVQSKKNIFK